MRWCASISTREFKRSGEDIFSFTVESREREVQCQGNQRTATANIERISDAELRGVQLSVLGLVVDATQPGAVSQLHTPGKCVFELVMPRLECREWPDEDPSLCAKNALCLQNRKNGLSSRRPLNESFYVLPAMSSLYQGSPKLDSEIAECEIHLVRTVLNLNFKLSGRELKQSGKDKSPIDITGPCKLRKESRLYIRDDNCEQRYRLQDSPVCPPYLSWIEPMHKDTAAVGNEGQHHCLQHPPY